MAKEEGDVWLNSIDTCNVRVHIKPHNSEASKPLVVHAQSELLCRIPYFAASLSQAWRLGQSDLTLECVPSTSPKDYLLCLQYLSPRGFKLPSTVNSALKVLRSADHLLYQECAEVCMAYLAAKVWSDEEEASVRTAISTIGLMLSSDLRMKLDLFDHVLTLKDVLLHWAQKVCEGDYEASASVESSLFYLKLVISEAPPYVAQMSASILMETWMSVSDGLIKKFTWSFLQTWCALTDVLLLYKDAKELLHAFVVKSKQLSETMHLVSKRNATCGFKRTLCCLLQRVVPGKGEDVMLLSTSQRASLVTTWTPFVRESNTASLSSAFKAVFSTLPVQEPSVVALMKEEASKEYFKECYEWWWTELVKRLCCPDLDANGSKEA